jgi:MOSC domain-containing protein YiiM
MEFLIVAVIKTCWAALVEHRIQQQQAKDNGEENDQAADPNYHGDRPRAFVATPRQVISPLL